MSPTSKRLVIDASIARSAGDVDAVAEISILCRDFLLVFRSARHQLVLSAEGQREWLSHRSAFAKRWLRTMFARRTVFHVEGKDAETLFKLIEKKAKEIPLSVKDRGAVKKDLHLVDAALATDKVVVSRDAIAHELFDTLAREGVQPLRAITWKDLEKEGAPVLAWLEEGAPTPPHSRLGKTKT